MRKIKVRRFVYEYLCSNGHPNVNLVADSLEGHLSVTQKYSSAWIDLGEHLCFVVMCKTNMSNIINMDIAEFMQN